jgi:hypothetical protein
MNTELPTRGDPLSMVMPTLAQKMIFVIGALSACGEDVGAGTDAKSESCFETRANVAFESVLKCQELRSGWRKKDAGMKDKSG